MHPLHSSLPRLPHCDSIIIVAIPSSFASQSLDYHFYRRPAMAATLEGDPAEPEPFSPSVFLDLPPTPHPDDDGDGEHAASSDDLLALPFIRRTLMEEDADDDMLYQHHHHDHPALLQAEQSLAQILSGSRSPAAAASSSQATNSTGAGTFFTLSPASADIPAFADATWPYDPEELSQLLLLLSSSQLQQSMGEASALFVSGAEEGRGTRHTTTTTVPAGDDGVVTMDMLNLAFLKGMEEASKFLPTNNSLLPSDGRVHASKQRVVESSSGNGRVIRGCKKTHRWDHDDGLEAEAEAGRRRKLMAPEPEENGDVADGVFLKGYEVALEKMHGLSISSSSVAVPTVQERRRRQRSSSDEAVDLRTLLIHCAEAVSTGNRVSATELLRHIKQRSSPRGDASQRLAYCFAQALELRLAGPQAHNSLVVALAKKPPMQSAPRSAVDLLRAQQLHLQVCSFRMVAFMFSQMAIINAVAGRKKVHIVDYGVNHGFQWPLLLGVWATREGGPPEVRITVIGFPQPGFRPAARIHETGRRLTGFARQRGVPFSFRGIVSAEWETVSAEDLDLEPDEVLVVNSLYHFGKLKDDGVDGVDSPSPRDMVLRNISRMRPDVFVLGNENTSHGAPFFVTRFREALFYYAAMFDMMDATAPRDCAERMLVERILGQWAKDAVACEGSDRVQRPEAYRQWQARNSRAGLRQLPLNPDTVKYLRKMVKGGYHKDFVIDVDQHWLLQGWKGRILCAMSTWVAADDDDVFSRQS